MKTQDDFINVFFGLDPESDTVRLAHQQVMHDDELLEKLVALREEKFSASEFAKTIGVKLEALEEFESDPIDADLHLLRLYAVGLGVSIRHRLVEKKVSAKGDAEIHQIHYLTQFQSGMNRSWNSIEKRKTMDPMIEGSFEALLAKSSLQKAN